MMLLLTVLPARVVQGKQLEEAHENAVEESKERMLEEVQARETSLAEALAESHAGLASMKRLHEASQRQLFAMQSRTEEEQVCTLSNCIVSTGSKNSCRGSTYEYRRTRHVR